MKLISCRFVFGSLVLLFVDILWVTSSELTEYLYHEKKFTKPFFIAYAKSVMFSIYLFGFIFFDSWWSQKSHLSTTTSDYYSIVSSDSDQQNLSLDFDDDSSDQDEDADDGNNNDTVINSSVEEMESVNKSSNSHFLSDSVWIPIKRCSDTSSLSGKSSETEDDEQSDGQVFFDNNPSIEQVQIDAKKSSPNVNFTKTKKQRKKNSTIKEKLKPKRRLVRFSNLIEVKQLSDKHADDAFLSRLSYSSFMRILYQHNRQRRLNNDNDNESTSSSQSSSNHNYDLNNSTINKLTIRETAILAFYFTWIWFSAHLSFHMGLQYSEAGLVNVLSSTTPLFTLLLGILFPSSSITDSISLTKLFCVLLSISSVAMISNIEPVNHQSLPVYASNLSSINNNKLNDTTTTILPLGSIWSLCGAFFYAVYIVLMRYNLVHDSLLNFPMFFGFLGLFSMIFMFPILMFLNFTQIERFEWPTQDQWILILVNGLCGTVVSELLWLLGSFMTSSLIGTISVSFTIPMAVYFDIFYKNIQYPPQFFFGTIPMFFSFIIIVIITQYEQWDPILDLIERCLYLLTSSSPSPRKCSNIRMNIESNGIINNNDDHHHSDSNETTTNTISNSTNDNDDDVKIISNNKRLNSKIDSTNDHHQLSSTSSTQQQQSTVKSSSSSLRHYHFNKQRRIMIDHHHKNHSNVDVDDDDDEHNEQTKSLIDAIVN